ncbi:DUF211 domain-containing protein [Halorientalis salina]|uniref:DUF211 domain-containing protein n=1 Tax=Halorientalis salina TaxID=2932266 RepID=UPI0010AC76E0|nr:DUF211 domain-containing protein [Halorientalis salina]
MAQIRRLVLDVLKPHEPAVPALADGVADCPGVEGVNVSLVESDREVENVKLTLEGEDIDYDAVRSTVDEFGASVHSIDEFACGETLIEAGETPQD